MSCNRKLKGRIIECFGTQYEFSRTVGEHEANVSRIIRGKRDIDPETRQKWADILGADCNELFGGKDDGQVKA